MASESFERREEAVVNKALTLKSGQTHVHRNMRPLLQLIEEERIDPRFVISHVLPLESAPQGYRMFRDKMHDCTKVVLKPGMAVASQTGDENGGPSAGRAAAAHIH